jgi:hypothetical protein
MASREDKVSKTPVIMFFLLAAVILAVALFTYMKTRGVNIIDFDMQEIASVFKGEDEAADDSRVLALEYDSRSHPAFNVYKGHIIKCTADYIKAVNKKGEEVWSKSISMRKPLVKTNASELLVADEGGRQVYVFKGNNIKWEAKTNSDIINAYINESGYVTLVQEAEGYKGMVKVFDPNGVEMLHRSIAENFVVGAYVSPSAENLLINSINTSGITLKSKLELSRVMEESPFAAVLKDDVVFASVMHMKDDSFAAAGDKFLIYFDKAANEVWSRDMGRIYSACLSAGKYIAAACEDDGIVSSPSGKGYRVEIINTKGQVAAQYTLRDEVLNLNSFNDLIAVNTGREVHFINTRGKLEGKIASKSDILNVYFISRLEAVIVTRSSVEVVKV